MKPEEKNKDLTKSKIPMPDTVLVGCEQHAKECEKCNNLQDGQVAITKCPFCEQQMYFCRTKPCKYKLHCVTPNCIKSSHSFIFISQHNHEVLPPTSKAPKKGQMIKYNQK
ncbi:hypothetical protein SSYRP_v1c05210 [Spiroplasma syrphidicola EA-1]|uniref:Uncharacterized protein n=1 Tax=Spiroplasma syrphidicola EA-1 TaxID=1276229 RepID=R4ULJ8_9MOLU|nr:hypothetical protein [Spiroplasma syrphidicola]AGM26111.1 hypothetical protein SSYRP_v1c05210 [Spiroplasma syrphidicola EA-1]